MAPSHEDAVYLARLAEQAERYEGPFTCFRRLHLAADQSDLLTLYLFRNGGQHEDCRGIQQGAVC